jgi:hypothetical protein
VLRRRTLLMIGALLAAACGADLKDGTLSLPITINESTINRMLSDKAGSVRASNDAERSLIDSVTALNFLEPNIIRVFGVRGSGAQRATGSFDVSFTTENKALLVAITDVKMPGLTVNSPEVKHLNAQLTSQLGAEANKENKGGITQARVSGRTLELTLSVPLR